MSSLQGDIELYGADGHKIEANDRMMVTQAMRVLKKHYPGYRWALGVDSEGGILYVKNLDVSTLWGYVIHLESLKGDPNLKRVVMAGGEILERANQVRGKETDNPTTKVDGLPQKYQPLVINGIPLIR